MFPMKNPTHLHHLFAGILILFAGMLFLLLLTFSIGTAASDIHGMVTDAETDDPIQGADVYIYDPNDKENNNHETTTDRTGNYEVELAPGDYEIKIVKDGYETHTGEETVGFEESVEHNAELQPDEGGGGGEGDTWVEGHVTEARETRAAGEPISGATVTVSDRKNTFKGTTDRSGYYNISVKEEGEYGVKITHEDYDAHEGRLDVEKGGNSYDAQLSPKSDDGGDGSDRKGNDGSGDYDSSDDGFEFFGYDGIMVAGWVLALVLLGIILMDRRASGSEEGKEKPQKTRKQEVGGRSTVVLKKKDTNEKPVNTCPKCGGKGEFNEEYHDHYCWECREYFEDLT
jgi:hypothetical protein